MPAIEAPLNERKLVARMNFPSVSPKPPAAVAGQDVDAAGLVPSGHIADAVTGHVAGTQDSRVRRAHVAHAPWRAARAPCLVPEMKYR